ncbi:hypothetical protein BDV06DRAFT_121362 [Aspergillus oleicola]
MQINKSAPFRPQRKEQRGNQLGDEGLDCSSANRSVSGSCVMMSVAVTVVTVGAFSVGD